MTTSQSLKLLIDKAQDNVFHAQPWPGHFRLRGAELEVLLSSCDIKKTDRVLELGCGNAFTAALLSRVAGEVVATDLMEHDSATHSIGLLPAREIVQELAIDNCALCACDAQHLPFSDGSFDVVFSAYLLEHIVDQERVLAETARVLKKGGRAFFVVPSIMERLVYFPYFYVYLLKRAWVHGMRKLCKTSSDKTVAEPHTIDETRPVEPLTMKRFRDNHPHFPWPEPHGEYSTYFKEIAAYRPRQWLGLFKQSGLNVIDTFSSMIMPWHILDVIHHSMPLFLYEHTLDGQKWLGRKRPFKYLGNNFCVVACKA